jgi:hypothetical protein
MIHSGPRFNVMRKAGKRELRATPALVKFFINPSPPPSPTLELEQKFGVHSVSYQYSEQSTA